ncbi:uncharacterized protein LOC121872130 [Homarus americanus]|uniref:Uncharacterized protein n=1 Tax=Homarus americanus TaxID=6706 RepID=A0A8J5TL86_HOMAM|nr:uncharacterized protein LOC121872130 [Homarus americanus]KAG7176745.1 hypothetical protein Hamer_G024784 [Homarus americanus]
MKSPVPQDAKTFVTWWTMVKEKPSLMTKAKQKLGSWELVEEHFQAGAWEAVVGLALHTSPETTHITLTEDRPWDLPGLLPVLTALFKVDCDCVVDWRRDWRLESAKGSITPVMAALLQCSKPSTVEVILPDDQFSSNLSALPAILDRLAHTSCSLNILLEGDFLAQNDFYISDYLLLPLLDGKARVRLRRLSCHMDVEAAEKFFQEDAQNDSSDEDFPGVRHRPMFHATPSIRYLEVLKIRISSLETIVALNRSLPLLELLDELEIHLTLQGFVFSEDIPQLCYTRDKLTLRLNRITDARAEWAGRVTAALSNQYAQVWLCWCYMTAAGGEVFLDQLKINRTLVGAVHVFALSGRPCASEFSSLSTKAALLATHTALYW